MPSMPLCRRLQLAFLLLAALRVSSHAAHDLGDVFSAHMPGFARLALLAALLIVPALLGEGVLGLALGVMLANGLLSVVTRTINDLYFVLNVQNLFITPLSIAKGLLLGLGATLLAAFVPALEAARTSPRAVLVRSTIEASKRRFLPWVVWTGIGLMVGSAVGMMIPGRSIPASFMFMFMLITGYAFITPGVFVWVLKMVQPCSGRLFGILGKMAVRNLIGGLSRTGVATSALVVAIAATVGVGIMINSFRSTVDTWLRSYLQADIYVTTSSSTFETGRTPLAEDFIRAVNDLAGVDSVTRARHLSLQSSTGLDELFVAEIPAATFDSYWFLDGDKASIYRDFLFSDAVIVSEPYAYHRNLARGDRLVLRTDQGEKPFSRHSPAHTSGNPYPYRGSKKPSGNIKAAFTPLP